MDYPRGSEWRKWDLHVHTPASIVNEYGGENGWDQYLDELAALPPEIKVIGLNDYWFFDGYKRVRQAFEAGKLPNLLEVFPVLEVRCDTFAGADGQLARLNLHLIGDPSIPIDDLDAQLRPLLQPTYRLTHGHAPEQWSQVVTRESLIELGKQIIAAAPSEHRSGFKGPLQTGFDNLNIAFEKVQKGIQDNTLLRDHVMLGLGKVEWAKIKWSQQAAAQKRHLINCVDVIFTASPDTEAFSRSLTALREAEVNSQLLHCSDAHHWMDSVQPNRLGNCLTWINADPTFKGLRQALQEYEHRVSIVDRPPTLARVNQSPQSTIANIEIYPRERIDGFAPVFDNAIPINPGFTVVIGNKGQGKSALLDVIALAANSDRDADFSFLTTDRFWSSDRKQARQYEVGLTWYDGEVATRGLHEAHDRSLAVSVDYLPQSLIEKVCSADPDSVVKRAFETEIERVLFRHLDESKRGRATDLAQFLTQQNASRRTDLAEARREIDAQCAQIIRLQMRQSDLQAMNLSLREEALLERITHVQTELNQVTDQLRSGGTTEQQDLAKKVDLARLARDAVIAECDAQSGRRDALRTMIDDVDELRAVLTGQIDSLQQTATRLAELIEGDATAVLSATFDESPIVTWRARQLAEVDQLEDNFTSSGGLRDQLAVRSRTVSELEEQQAAIGAEVQALVRRQTDLRAQLTRLEGEPSEADSLAGVRNLMAEVLAIPEAVDQANNSLRAGFQKAHSLLLEMMAAQKHAYQPATEFVEANELVRNIRLEFDVEFRGRGFVDRWLPTVNRQRLGGFYDVSGKDRDTLVLGDTALNDPDALFAKLQNLEARLASEGGALGGASRSLSSIMRSGHRPEVLLSTIYGLEWLESQYVIRSGGAELSELSPGQRGLVLLLFYLLVDKSERPLLLDQPEDNLDNQTVKNFLVPALRDAARRRQVIAVTHNPNFAVVGDADQIIDAGFDGSFSYRSGSLAAINIGRNAIDVLEGTRDAFLSRQAKYTDVVGD